MKSRFLVFLIPASVFFALHASRPFLIGFYHDDWSIFVEPHLFSLSQLIDYCLKAYADRPLLCAVFYSIARFWDGRPETLTLIASTFVAASALCFHIFISRVVSLASDQKTVIPACATAMWIAIPWSLGYSLWASGAATLIALIFYMLSSVLFIDYVTRGRGWRLLAALLTLAMSFVGYQAYYLGFVPVIALAVVLGQEEKSLYKRAAFSMTSGLAVQMLAVTIVRMTTPKHIAYDVTFALKNFYIHLPKAISHSMGLYWIVLLSFYLIVFTLSIIELARSDKKGRNRLIVVTLICLCGAFIGTLPFSIAGYNLSGIGMFSRTTVSANIWLVVLAAVIAVPLSKPGVSSRLLHTAFATIILTLTLSSLSRMQPWIKSWELQKEILASMPLDAIRQMSASDVLVLNAPIEIQGITVFGAPWDISSAVFSRPTMVGLFPMDARPLITPSFRDSGMSWDTAHSLFTIRSGWTTTAHRVWVFTPAQNDLREITKAGPIEMP